MIRPSFQFYPADWQANSNLRRCSHEEKGIWIDVMCLLHDQSEYGIVRWPLAEIAQAVGTTTAKLRGLVNKGVMKGVDIGLTCEALVFVPRSGRKNGPAVTLIEQQPGPIWYSSRMVEDEYKRVVRADSSATPKGAPDPSPKGGFGATPKGAPDPSPFSCAGASRAAPSSSSSSLKAKAYGGSTPINESTPPDEAAAGAPPPGSRIGELCKRMRQLGINAAPGQFAKPEWAPVLAHFDDDFMLAVIEQRRRADPTKSYTAAYFLPVLIDIIHNPSKPQNGGIHAERQRVLDELTGRAEAGLKADFERDELRTVDGEARFVG